MGEHRKGVLDTSVIIDISFISGDALPAESAIAAITLAELTAGPLTAATPMERATRIERLQWTEGKFEAIPFDVPAARAYGRIYAATLATNRKPRGGRAVDLLIAATALSRELPLYTRNPADFSSIAEIVEIVGV